jgi:hypothetical protein
MGIVLTFAISTWSAGEYFRYMTYLCPVCGFEMREPPRDFAICPSCGTEFGYDDAKRSHLDLRLEWMRAGTPWFSTNTHPPFQWNAWAQLRNAGYVYLDVHTVQSNIERGEKQMVGQDWVVQFS